MTKDEEEEEEEIISLSLSPPSLLPPHLRAQHHRHVVPAVEQRERPREEPRGRNLIGVEDVFLSFFEFLSFLSIQSRSLR